MILPIHTAGTLHISLPTGLSARQTLTFQPLPSITSVESAKIWKTCDQPKPGSLFGKMRDTGNEVGLAPRSVGKRSTSGRLGRKTRLEINFYQLNKSVNTLIHSYIYLQMVANGGNHQHRQDTMNIKMFGGNHHLFTEAIYKRE